MDKTCIIIAGPTAVGKTSAAIEVAKHFSAEIISSDSRQCYKELNIGVAKPSATQLAEVTHHFINSHSIHTALTAADFENYALQTAEELFRKSNTVVMVGGTGLYIKAFSDGLDDIPTPDENFRHELKSQYQLHGIGWLAEQLAQKDPLFFKSGEMQNPHRMMRALEVMHASGKSILSHYSGRRKVRDFRIIKVALELPRADLYDNINKRTEQMMEDGLLLEAKGLVAWKHLNPLQTVGYREIFEHLEGVTSLERAVELIKQNTRHYAKRQMTWFKKDDEFNWVNAGDMVKLIAVISEKLSAPTYLR